MERRIIQWNERYSIGIESLDEQHKQLLTLCNNLYINGHKQDEFARDFFRQCVSVLVNFVQFHIFEEEQLLVRTGYPEYHSHKAEHSKAIALFSRHLAYLGTEDDVWIKESIPDLQRYIINHITVNDRDFAAYVHALNHPRYTRETRIPTELFLG
ncbi:MAG: hemerythrin domain-containing protein [Treponema sp.]|nr:hemerythrin domain-containing protein [Treponema sp.]